MTNPVIVIECEPAHFEALQDVVRAALRDHFERGNGQPWRSHLAIEDSAEMVLDVFREPKPGAGRHVLRLTEQKWNVEHSLMCRMAGLENCPVTDLVSIAVEEGHLDDPGDYRLSVEGNVLTWEELE